MTARDYIAAFVSPVSTIAKLLSFAVLLFSGRLAEYLPIGVGYCLIGAALSTMVFALWSDLPFAIAVPESKTVAVLASLAGLITAELVAEGRGDEVGPTVLAALILAALSVGIASYLFGVLKLGKLIRFTPYPVIGGFMAASGWILASGGIRVLLHEPLSLNLLLNPPRGSDLAKLLVAVAFALAVRHIRRVTHPLAFPALLILGSVAIHLGLWFFGVTEAIGRKEGWLLALPASGSLPVPWLFDSFSKIHVIPILHAYGEYAAVIMVTLATLLLSMMAIEVGTSSEVDLNHELKVNGLANIIVGLGGGMVGTISANRTLFHYKMGARARWSAALAGALCLAPMFLGVDALGYVPVPVLVGLLLQLGFELLEEWLVRGWAKMQRADYGQLVLIFLSIVFFDFVAGVGLGVLAACVTFAINTSRSQLIRASMNRTNYASRVDRPAGQTAALIRNGEDIQIIRLQGFIFFGSAYSLVAAAKNALAQSRGAGRSLILDCSHVLGIDSSAVMNLTKLRLLAQREHVTLVFSAPSAGVEFSLRAGGVIEGADDPLCRVFGNLETAMEWCEEKLLSCLEDGQDTSNSAEAWLDAELGKAWLLEAFDRYFERIDLSPGKHIFDQGEDGDSLYILSSGRVSVLLRAQSGKDIRLRSMLGQTLIGEMGFYRGSPRGASVRVNDPGVVYRLTSDSMERMERESPSLAIAFHKFVIRVLSARLEFSNREVATLE